MHTEIIFNFDFRNYTIFFYINLSVYLIAILLTMAAKVWKNKLEGNELDLSMMRLSEIPVAEIVSKDSNKIILKFF